MIFNRKHDFGPGTKVGVLGGGQLARMLALKGHELGLEVHVLSLSEEDPAAQVTRYWHKGDPNQPEDLAVFCENLELVTFESEFLSASAFQQLSAPVAGKIFPRPEIMAEIQDRWTQKQLLKEHGLPTSPFVLSDAKTGLKELHKDLGKQLVFKKRLFGYDGYGTYFLDNLRWKEGRQPEGAENYLVEQKISFQRELAIQVARNHSGKFSALPLVESFQKDAKCFWVQGPIRHRALSPLLNKIYRFMNRMNYVGILAFELFDSKQGLLVNELAPRVHNTAHYSLDALEEDQFTLHWKALLNFPLRPSRCLSGGFAMLNLLGEGNNTEARWSSWKNGHLHWYGKKENRSGRKMGHLNVVDHSPKTALKKALATKRSFHL